MDAVNNQDSPDSKLHFLDYWRIIRLRKLVILTIFFLVAITVTVVTFNIPKTYESFAKISVDRDTTDLSPLDRQQVSYGADQTFLNTEFDKIQSSYILYPVITNLNLSARWKQDSGYVPSLEMTYQMLKKQLNVKQTRNTSLIEIHVYSYKPEEAAEIANKIAEVYKASRKSTRALTRKLALEKLTEDLALKEAQVRETQSNLNHIRIEAKVPDLGGDSVNQTVLLNVETLRDYEKTRSGIASDYEKWKSTLNEIKSKSMEDLMHSMATIFPDSELTTLAETYTMATHKVLANPGDYGINHPEMVKMIKVREQALDDLQKKIKGIIGGLESQVASLSNRLDTATRQVASQVEQNNRLAQEWGQYNEVKRELEEHQRIRMALAMKINLEQIENILPTDSTVTVIESAVAQLFPVSPKKVLNIALGCIVGLCIGIGAAFFIEYMDTSIKTIDDVERALQSPVIGVIPQNVGSLLEEGPDSPHAEAYRVLRTNILFSRKNEGFNTMTVISGGPGEGKSTTLFNLATVFAQNGVRVLVVDSDLRRPSIHKILKISNDVGLTNYLLKNKQLEEVIQTTSMTGLDVMPSGKLPSSSMGILSSTKMKELISELKKRYDFVFFDSPPIIGVSDASILASEVDMVIQVIQYRRYPQQMTIRTKQMIQKIGANLIGLVLNNISMSSDDNYYYYGGYYATYGKQDDKTDVKRNGSSKPNEKADEPRVGIKSKY
ncbi:MAG: ywqD 2 [Verrucomicrobiales bacterium]|nr:ywqD 2 [Verrucomicrobiales bacterium]MDB6131617.1 ywqD 2 [Verrucomicrobiales bacterium]